MHQLGFTRIFDQATDLPRAVRRLGLGATMGLVQSHLTEYGSHFKVGPRPAPNSLRSVRPRGCTSQIHYRINTTDINVLQQVFLSGEYDCAGSEPDPEFVVDCGANIGCASVYFLNRYPKARVVAVEADAGNSEVCRKNLEPYGERAKVIHGAIWPRSEPLTVERGEGEEWSFSVRPCREGEPGEIEGVSLADLAREAPDGRIDLLKIDIEGAELELFSADVEPWLSRTKALVIELHGADCHDTVLGTLRRHRFRLEDAGYVWIARREGATPEGATVSS
jgi:FkbM family methyltransferase